MAVVDVAEIHALDDRRVPATSGNIDHLVIGPGHDRHPMRWSDVLCLVAVGANA